MVWLAVALAPFLAPSSFPVQFGRSTIGREVQILVDGRVLETTFAGKLSFRDATHPWSSVCADVRGPIKSGEYFPMAAYNSSQMGGNVARAGNIVARCFGNAQTPDQCAGLQIAVWETLEGETDRLDLTSGTLQIKTTPGVISYAEFYFQYANVPGNAVYLMAGGGGQAPGAGGQAGGGQGGQGAGGQGGGGQGGGGGGGGGAAGG